MSETHWAFIHPFQLRLQRGIEVYLWNLAVALAQQGIQVDILTWDGPLDIPDYAQVPGVRIRKVPAVRYYQAIIAVFYYIYWLFRGRYQHVFVHFAGYGEGFVLRLLRSVFFSVVFHFPLSQVPHRYREFTRWRFQRDAVHLVAVSRATAVEVEAWAGRSCVVIGHGVDLQRFRPDLVQREKVRRELGIGALAPVLISVAALEERKGMQWVIRAIPRLLAEMLDLHYIVIGDGPYCNSLERLVQELGMESRVHLLGSKLDVQPYLCAADVMMVLAKGEASSISLLEALACGLPAITSKHPPFDELVHEEYGMRVDEGNTPQVTTAVMRLFDDSETRIKMGIAGRTSWVAHNHNWDRIAFQYCDLIAERR